MALALQINGEARTLEPLTAPVPLDAVIAALGLHAGRVAVEHNGDIVPRSTWHSRTVHDTDKIEVVHFVGGGK